VKECWSVAWALGQAELKAYDEPCESEAVAMCIGWLNQRSDTVLENPTLRPRSEIEGWANTYLTVHWRLRQHRLAPSRHGPRQIDLADYVASAKWGPLTVANIALIDSDLSIGGTRIDPAAEDTFEQTCSIVRERHKALNWLRGDAPLYSAVRTPT
jgi:hypothetical protein